jgi:predicted phosphodiesterase
MRILILSDIHGNLPALEAVLAAEPCSDAVVFCGDVVDYGPQPVECVRWLKDHTDYLVRGNHDHALALDVDCQCLGTFRDYYIYILLGHTHVQGMQTCGPVTVVNPGSVGLARDCSGEACYAVYEQGAVRLRRCCYDVSQTVAALRAAPLPPQVVDGLARVLGSA